MAAISTVTGEVASEDLGVTLFHEHLAMVSPGLELNWPQTFDRPAEVENAVELLSRAAAVGVRTLVDLTTIDLGRDITMQQQIGERSEVQIVVATGVHMRPSRFLLHTPEERIVELFVDDIERGIGGTSIRAGALRRDCCTSSWSAAQRAPIRTPPTLRSCRTLHGGSSGRSIR